MLCIVPLEMCSEGSIYLIFGCLLVSFAGAEQNILGGWEVVGLSKLHTFLACQCFRDRVLAPCTVTPLARTKTTRACKPIAPTCFAGGWINLKELCALSKLMLSFVDPTWKLG